MCNLDKMMFSVDKMCKAYKRFVPYTTGAGAGLGFLCGMTLTKNHDWSPEKTTVVFGYTFLGALFGLAAPITVPWMVLGSFSKDRECH